jgi:imidazolonepropionase-like amidohydrolase
MVKASHQVGTVSEGKYADINAVRGDVIRHIDLAPER